MSLAEHVDSDEEDGQLDDQEHQGDRVTSEEGCTAPDVLYCMRGSYFWIGSDDVVLLSKWRGT